MFSIGTLADALDSTIQPLSCPAPSCTHLIVGFTVVDTTKATKKFQYVLHCFPFQHVLGKSIGRVLLCSVGFFGNPSIQSRRQSEVPSTVES